MLRIFNDFSRTMANSALSSINGSAVTGSDTNTYITQLGIAQFVTCISQYFLKLLEPNETFSGGNIWAVLLNDMLSHMSNSHVA